MILHKNKKAYFDYEILKTFTTGIVLTGGEVRACREGNLNLKGAYISINEERNQAILKGANISQFTHDQDMSYKPARERILLLNQRELIKIQNELNTPGVTLVPLSLFTQGRLLKLEIGLARGKKQYDKRETIKQRDILRRKIH